METKQIRYLNLLANNYPTKEVVIEEIINLKMILSMPKGTEYFISDIHGEDVKFRRILNNCSGVIQDKIETIFKDLSKEKQTALKMLIYEPEKTIISIDKAEYYHENLIYLVILAKELSAKYTRSRLKRMFNQSYSYLLDELLNGQNFKDEQQYLEIIEILSTVDKCGSFLIELCNLIKKLAVDTLHILGDLYDRGPRGDKVVEMLKEYHSVDIQWGNHDVLMIGAAANNLCCMAMVVLNAFKYDSLEMLENGYGISLKNVFKTAQIIYPNLPIKKACQKLMAIIMFKLEGQLIIKHPEYQLNDKLYLDKIIGDKIIIDDQEYLLKDAFLPTIDSNDPYQLNELETALVQDLDTRFKHSEKLHNHIKFLLNHGSIYKISNNNLLFHGCIPLDFKGQFVEVKLNNQVLKGKGYLDYLEHQVRMGYLEKNQAAIDLYWFLWSGRLSPFCGRDLKHFIRMFVADESLGIEKSNAYYGYLNDEQVCQMILNEFSLTTGHIINGHTPVKIKDGQSPVKANGKLLVIDGGFSPKYYDQTGNSGYTLISDSYGMVLRSHCHEISWQTTLKDEVIEKYSHRLLIRDCDNGKDIIQTLKELELLLQAYRDGTLLENKHY